MAVILNTSLDQSVVAKEWEAATVVPLPKTNPPSVIKIRPISLTFFLCKAAESFISQWAVGYILPQIYDHKFGWIKGHSTTHCLLDLTNELYKHSDKPGFICSLVTTEFSKAF